MKENSVAISGNVGVLRACICGKCDPYKSVIIKENLEMEMPGMGKFQVELLGTNKEGDYVPIREVLNEKSTNK